MHPSPLFPGTWQRNTQWGDNVLRCEIGNHPYHHGLISSISWPNFDGVPGSSCPVVVRCRIVGRAFYHGSLSRRFMAHRSPAYLHINTQRRTLIYMQRTAKLELVSASCLPKRFVVTVHVCTFSWHIIAYPHPMFTKFLTQNFWLKLQLTLTIAVSKAFSTVKMQTSWSHNGDPEPNVKWGLDWW